MNKRVFGILSVIVMVLTAASTAGVVLLNSREGELSNTATENNDSIAIKEDETTSTASNQQPQHIILLMTDDQGYGQAGYLGHPELKTPNLDAMAKDGTVLDHFYATAPVCSPTRISILTAQHPYRHECYTVGTCSIDTAVPTLADNLKQAGYSTAHFGKWHIGNLGTSRRNSGNLATPDMTGFDTYFTSQLPFEMGTTNFYTNQGAQEVDVQIDTSLFLAEKAIAHVEEAVESGEKSFTVIWYPSPHSPYNSAEEFSDSDSDYDQLLGELKGFDASIGQLRSSLEELGIKDDTLLWFNSDNGSQDIAKRSAVDKFGNAGLRGGKDQLYEGGIRVPAIIEYPGLEMPKTVSEPISTIDIAPTILQLANAEPLIDIDGSDQSGVITGQTYGTSPQYFWYERDVESISNINDAKSAVIDWPYKLIKNNDGDFELYNLATDPNETINVTDSATSAKLLEGLEAWQDGILGQYE